MGESGSVARIRTEFPKADPYPILRAFFVSSCLGGCDGRRLLAAFTRMQVLPEMPPQPRAYGSLEFLDRGLLNASDRPKPL